MVVLISGTGVLSAYVPVDDRVRQVVTILWWFD